MCFTESNKMQWFARQFSYNFDNMTIKTAYQLCPCFYLASDTLVIHVATSYAFTENLIVNFFVHV